MKNKNDKRGKSPANFYDRIAEMLGKAAIPQTITVEAANPQKIQDDEKSVFATQKGVVRNDRAGR